jgi:hypothetical protein
MLSTFLTFLNTRRINNPMDRIYGNLEKIDNHRRYISNDKITLKNIFRGEKK